MTTISIKNGEVQLDGEGELTVIIEGNLGDPVTREQAELEPIFVPQLVTVYGLDRASQRFKSETIIATNTWSAFDQAYHLAGSSFDPLVAKPGYARRIVWSPLDAINHQDPVGYQVVSIEKRME